MAGRRTAGATDIRALADDLGAALLRAVRQGIADEPPVGDQPWLATGPRGRDQLVCLCSGVHGDEVAADRGEDPGLTFHGEPPARLALFGRDLRMVLLRDANSRGETPQWYAPAETDEETPGFSAGLWAAPGAGPDDRVFISTVGKPPAAGTVRNDLRKLVPGKDWPHGPAATAWNPQALELTVLGCLSESALAAAGCTGITPDRPAVVAAAAHQLRFHDEYHPLSRAPPTAPREAGRGVLPAACRGPVLGSGGGAGL